MPDGLVQDLFHQINLNPTKEQSKFRNGGGTEKINKLIEVRRLVQAIINIFKFLGTVSSLSRPDVRDRSWTWIEIKFLIKIIFSCESNVVIVVQIRPPENPAKLV